MRPRTSWKLSPNCSDSNNTLSIAKFNSFMLALPDLVNFLFGYAEKPSALKLYSANGYMFVDRIVGSKSPDSSYVDHNLIGQLIVIS